MAEYVYTNIEENRFWLKLLSVKAQIIYNSLPPDKPEVRNADIFHRRFEALYLRAKEEVAGKELTSLNWDARQTTIEFRNLVLGILRKQLLADFYLNIKPSFVNHIVSMTDEYLYLLGYYVQNKRPTYNPIVQDIFWLPAFEVDARLFRDNVEFFDTKITDRAAYFEKRLGSLFSFAITLQGFMRTELEEFPVLQQYRKNLRNTLNEFAEFVVDLLSLAHKNMLPGTLMLLELECAYRILCYYTTQLAALDESPKPPCDPGGPLPVK